VKYVHFNIASKRLSENLTEGGGEGSDNSSKATHIGQSAILINLQLISLYTPP